MNEELVPLALTQYDVWRMYSVYGDSYDGTSDGDGQIPEFTDAGYYSVYQLTRVTYL